MAGSLTVVATELVERSMLLLQLGIALHECAVEPALLVMSPGKGKVLVRIRLSATSSLSGTLLDRLNGIPGVETVESGPWQLAGEETAALAG
jgi:hypothetical protein